MAATLHYKFYLSMISCEQLYFRQNLLYLRWNKTVRSKSDIIMSLTKRTTLSIQYKKKAQDILKKTYF